MRLESALDTVGQSAMPCQDSADLIHQTPWPHGVGLSGMFSAKNNQITNAIRPREARITKRKFTTASIPQVIMKKLKFKS